MHNGMAAAVNFFKYDLTAYDGNTSHLSWDEDCAYNRLMRAYYRREGPLPHTPPTELYRITRALTKIQRQAVDKVLAEFFERRDDGWHNKRCDAEIVAYRQSQGSTENRRDSEKERQRRHREKRARLYEALRDQGVTAPWNATTEELEAALSRQTIRGGHAPVTRDDTAIRSSDVQNLRKEVVDVVGSSAAPRQKPIEKSPELLKAIQNPAWMFSLEHALLTARHLQIPHAGKTHDELKAAIAERAGIEKAA